jgi:hypothetical protein
MVYFWEEEEAEEEDVYERWRQGRKYSERGRKG